MHIPEVMTTDQGKEFHNQVNAELHDEGFQNRSSDDHRIPSSG